MNSSQINRIMKYFLCFIIVFMLLRT